MNWRYALRPAQCWATRVGCPLSCLRNGELTAPATPAAPLPLQVLAAEAEAKHPLWDIRTHAEAEKFWQRVRCSSMCALKGRHYSGRAASCELPGLPHALCVQHIVASACRVAALHGTHCLLLRRCLHRSLGTSAGSSQRMRQTARTTQPARRLLCDDCQHRQLNSLPGGVMARTVLH